MRSTLRVLGLLSLVLSLPLTACDDEGSGSPGVVRQTGGAGLDDVTARIIDFECGCLGELEGPQAEAECRAEADEVLASESIGACIDEALARHPDAAAPLQCLVDLSYDMLECSLAEGCPGQFVCNDGEAMPESWVCDGFDDCAGGEDEAQDCPAPHTCGSGESLPQTWVCDGFEDCADGSDEPADCELSCEATVALDFEQCPPMPEAFDADVEENCFESQSSEPGCSGEGCGDVPSCDDGSCSAPVDAPAALRSVAPGSGPRRPLASFRAARQLLRRG